MSRATIPAFDADIVAILRSRGFEPFKTRKDGSITVMKLGGKFVYSRNNAVPIHIAAQHINANHYCHNDIDLVEALDEIRRRENLLDDAVEKLAQEMFNHLHAKGVNVMLNHPKVGWYEFYTHNTTSSVQLFRLVGELDRWDEVEIEVRGTANVSGPVATLEEVLKTFEEWAEYGDTTARECGDYEMTTIQCLDFNIHAMIYRGLKNITMVPYTVRVVSEDAPQLQSLLDRHHNRDMKEETHIAYKIEWVKNQLDCEVEEGLHA